MKKIIAAIVIGFAVFSAALVGAATYQPTSMGWVTFSISSGTVSQITNSTAPTVGYPRWCYDCTASGGAGTVCYSTGSAKAFQFVLSTGTVCK